MRPDLILFDCDGVLVDSEPPMTALMARFFSAHGLPLEPDQAHTLFVGGTLRGAGDEAVRRGAVLPDDWFETFTAQMYDLLRQGVPLIPGVAEILDAIDAAGLARAIVSNGSMEKMRVTLPPHGLWNRFEGRILSGYVHGAPKPAPDMVELAMKQAGVTAAQTVMIDDSAAGCRSGVAAGVRTFGFATEGQDAELAAVGAEVVGSMADIQRKLDL